MSPAPVSSRLSSSTVDTRPRIVAIAAGRSGAGVSTTAVMLAASLAAQGRPVLLVDAADRPGALPLALGLTTSSGDAPSAVAPNLTLLIAGVRDAFETMRSMAARFEVVVVDAGATATTIRAAVTAGATHVLVVTGGDRIAVSASYALVKWLLQLDAPLRVELLANRIPDPVARLAHDGINQAARRFLSRTIPLAGVIPNDPDFSAAMAAGLGVHAASLGSSAALVMQDLGAQVLEAFHPRATSLAETRSASRN